MNAAGILSAYVLNLVNTQSWYHHFCLRLIILNVSIVFVIIYSLVRNESISGSEEALMVGKNTRT